MVATLRVVHTELENLLDYLIESELAIYTTSVRKDGDLVTWRPFPGAAALLPNHGNVTAMHYRHWIEHGHFSAMLWDGALLQVSYEFAARQIVGHRLAYVPSPFDMDETLLQEEALLDVFDVCAMGNATDVILRGPIRFDFDRDAAGPGHPAAHLTLNSSDCRIPCAEPLRLGHFVEFVFKHFYPHQWEAHPYLGDLSKVGWGSRTVTQDEMRGLHLSWVAS